MGKKKYKNVKIENVELKPTTIGEISSTRKSLIPLFIIIIVFLAFTYFLPDIAAYVENGYSFNGISNNGSSTPSEGSGNLADDEDDEAKKIYYEEEMEIVTDNFSIRNIIFTNTLMTFEFVITSDNDLTLLNNYLEFYSENNTLLYRVKITENMRTEYTIDETFTYFKISEITENEYPEVEIIENILSCSNENSNTIYTFENNELVKMYQTLNFINVSPTYNEDMINYSNKASEFNDLVGINAITKASNLGFDYIIEIDLLEIKESNLEIDYFYESGTSPNKVKFELETNGEEITCR